MILSDKTKGRPIFGCHDARCVTQNRKQREERQHRGHAGGDEWNPAIIRKHIVPTSYTRRSCPTVRRTAGVSPRFLRGTLFLSISIRGQKSMVRYKLLARIQGYRPSHTALSRVRRPTARVARTHQLLHRLPAQEHQVSRLSRRKVAEDEPTMVGL